MDYKTQEEYLMLLAEELKYLKPKDAQQVIDYYFNRISIAIDNGQKEIDVLRSLPTPKEAAERVYETHGEKYLAARQRHLKFKENVSNIGDVIIGILMLGLFVAITIFIIRLFITNIKMTASLFGIKAIADKVVSGLIGVGYCVCLIIIYLYLFDLMYFISTFFIFRGLNLKNKDIQNKFGGFVINEKINSATKKKHFTLNILLVSIAVIVFCAIASYAIKGYAYRSINNVNLNVETIELNETTNLEIDGEEYIVNIHNSDHNYIEYHYEFNHLPEVLNGDTTIIKIKNNVVYDFLDLFNEPLQVIDLYCTEDLCIKLSFISNGITNIKEAKLEKLSITGQYLYTDISSSEINYLNAEAVKNELYINDESNINDLKYKVIQNGIFRGKNFSSNSVDINNRFADIELNKASVNNVMLNNNGGKINISDSVFDSINLENANSEIYLTNNEINSAIFNAKSFSNVHYDNITSDNVKVELNNGSYFNSFGSNINIIEINSVESNIFIENLETISYKSNGSGKLSKTSIENINVKDFSLSQSEGFVNVKNISLESGLIVAQQSQTVELENFSGTSIDMKLFMIGKSSNGYTKITQPSDSTFVFNIKYIDTYSMSNLLKNGNVIVEINMEEPNE